MRGRSGTCGRRFHSHRIDELREITIVVGTAAVGLLQCATTGHDSRPCLCLTAAAARNTTSDRCKLGQQLGIVHVLLVHRHSRLISATRA